jgi:hypothetical protein
MNPVMHRYDALLTALFDARIVPPVPALSQSRFRAERNRRLLSIGRTMARCWPKTLVFEQALRGRAFVECVASEIPKLIHEVSTMEEAIETSALRWLKSSAEPVSRDLFKFEQAQRNVHGLEAELPTRQERAVLRRMDVSRAHVLTFSLDVLVLARSIGYLESCSASTEYYVDIVPPPVVTRLAFGMHNNEPIVVVLSELH